MRDNRKRQHNRQFFGKCIKCKGEEKKFILVLHKAITLIAMREKSNSGVCVETRHRLRKSDKNDKPLFAFRSKHRPERQPLQFLHQQEVPDYFLRRQSWKKK